MWLQDNNIQDLTFFNLFFVMTNRYGIKKLYTPPDNGCILNGVQRQSILELAKEIKKDTGLSIEERNIGIREVVNAHSEERLHEVIGTSTSSHVLPVNRIVYQDNRIDFGTTSDSHYVSYLRNLLTGVMKGNSSHPWISNMSV